MQRAARRGFAGTPLRAGEEGKLATPISKMDNYVNPFKDPYDTAIRSQPKAPVRCLPRGPGGKRGRVVGWWAAGSGCCA